MAFSRAGRFRHIEPLEAGMSVRRCPMSPLVRCGVWGYSTGAFSLCLVLLERSCMDCVGWLVIGAGPADIEMRLTQVGMKARIAMLSPCLFSVI